jgi:periplasmic divalent cation tolerance protein
MSDVVVGMVTCGSLREARRLANALLDRRCAACVNIVGRVESHYWWQGKRASGKETLLLIKTTSHNIKEATKVIKSIHSYDVPEIVFLPVAAGESRYLSWVRQSARALVVAVALSFLATGSTAFADRIDDLKKQLGSADEEQRAEAGDELIRIGGGKVTDIFRELVTSSNPERRMMGTAGLLQVSDADEDMARVRDRLKDESSIVRWSAATALGRSTRSEAAAWLEDAARSDESESVREAAVEGATRLRARIAWNRSHKASLQEARQGNRMVLAFFTMFRSDVCDKFEAGVLADAAVVNAARDFVCWRNDIALHPGEATRLDVRGVPSILILDAQGHEVSRVSGMVEARMLVAELAAARQGAMTFREARLRAARDPSDVAANWKVAKQFLDDDRDDLAEPHLKNVIGFDDANAQGWTDDAIFALGFSYGKRRSHAKAVYCMEHLLKRWPDFKDRDKALYCLGLSHLALGHRKEAQDALLKLTAEHAGGSLAKPAQAVLDRLKTEVHP